MKILTLAVAISLGLLAGCHRSETTPPSPKTDTSSTTPAATAGSSSTTATPSTGAPVSASGATTSAGTTSSAVGTPDAAEKKEGSNPTQGQVDPKHADQHRDFQQKGDAAGPQSSDTQPTSKN